MTDGITRIVAILDAAAPIEPPEVPLAVSPHKSARRQARSAGSSSAFMDDGGGLSAAPTPSSGGEVSSSFSSASAVLPHPLLEGRITAATLEEQEAERRSKLDATIAECAALDHSDTDNGKRLIRYFGEDLLVRRESGVSSGAWLHWTGTHWDLDNGAAGAAILCQQVGDLIMLEAPHIEPTEAERAAIDDERDAKAKLKEMAASGEPDDEAASASRAALIADLTIRIKDGTEARRKLSKRRSDRRKHGLATKNRARMTSMQDCAGPHMRRPIDAFNADPLLVATASHTLRFVQKPDPDCPDPDVVRLKWTVEAEKEHRRDDLITALIPVAYDPRAVCPKWRANLERFQPVEQKRRTVQQFTGLGLLGKPIQRVMFHHGPGANFKSTFLEVVTRTLGPSFAIGLPTESLIGNAEGNAGAPRPDLERVFGKRMLRVLEMPQGAELRADLVKKLAGGEGWPVRTLYKSFFEFVPIAKTHMSGQEFPRFDGSDGGLLRRLLFVEWPVIIDEKEQRDSDEVIAELMAEASGILNWLIEGALDYLENGLVVADEIRADTREYFDEMDPTAHFVRDCVAIEDGHNEQSRVMFEAYKAHCAANAKHAVQETRFGRTLKKKFKRDDTGRRHVYLNVRLHDVPEMSHPSAHAAGAERMADTAERQARAGDDEVRW